jgi:hypothetical protein
MPLSVRRVMDVHTRFNIHGAQARFALHLALITCYPTMHVQNSYCKSHTRWAVHRELHSFDICIIITVNISVCVATIMFTYEASFTREGIANLQSVYALAKEMYIWREPQCISLWIGPLGDTWVSLLST